jgi:tRNA(Glu) U13 pseudouridine synthase TruD
MRTGRALGDPATKAKLTDRVNWVEANGFYNFYYLQRFGTPRLTNYVWGYHILRGDCEQALKYFITEPGDRELPYFQNLRQDLGEHWRDWRYIKEKLNPFPLIFTLEHQLLDHLLTHPTDFRGALLLIPEQVTLWIYAVSSWLFNKQLSTWSVKEAAPPEKLPLFLSADHEDWAVYEEVLRQNGIFPPPFFNLRPFRNIQLRHREVSTRDAAEVHGTAVVDDGFVISFSLGKGQYATTFLSHLFTLVGGEPPTDIVGEIFDSKAALGLAPITDTLRFFADILHSKKEKMFESADEQT